MIKVEHLTKYYGDFLAVDDLSFTIEEGHVYGFLGPNGAGKSTTMNILTGCLSATSGRVEIGGHDIFEEPGEAKHLIGYLPEQPPLYLSETPEEYLRFVGEAKGLRGGELTAQIEAVMEQVKIESVRHRPDLRSVQRLPAAGGHCPGIAGRPEGDHSRRTHCGTGPYPDH